MPQRRNVIGLFVVLLALPVVQGCIVAGDEQVPPTRTPIVRSSRAPDAAVPPATATLPVQIGQNPPAATSAPIRTTAPGPTPVSAGTQGATPANATASSLAAPTSAATAASGSPRSAVRDGDPLSGLSRQYGVPVAELAQTNGIPPDTMLRTGQALQLPAGVWSSEKRIRVTGPASGSSVRSPVVVEGTAATFESAIVVELLDPGAAAPLARATVRVANADVGLHGPFRAELAVPAGTATRSAVVRVYWTSPRDGSPLDEIRVPVTLAPAG